MSLKYFLPHVYQNMNIEKHGGRLRKLDSARVHTCFVVAFLPQFICALLSYSRCLVSLLKIQQKDKIVFVKSLKNTCSMHSIVNA